MSINVLDYDDTIINIVDGNWQEIGYNVVAQICNENYIYSTSHKTRSSIESSVVSSPVPVNGRYRRREGDFTVLGCDNLEFSIIGQNSGSWIVIHEMLSGSPRSDDKLLFAIKLNSTVTIDQPVAAVVKVSTNGLFAFTSQPYLPPPPVVIDPNAPLPCTIGKTISAPENWESGDVICVSDFAIDDGLKLENLDFDPPVTLRTTNGTRFLKTGYSGVCLEVINCHGLIFEGGWLATGGRDGWRFVDCDRIWLYDPKCVDVGQTGIIHRIETAGLNLDTFHIIKPYVRKTGQVIANFGEGIYIGNGGTTPEIARLGTMTGVLIEDCDISDTSAEAIDIKVQCTDWEVRRGVIDGIGIPFNGALVFGTDDSDPAPAVGLVDGLVTRNIINRNGGTWAHYAIGHGNVTIKNARMEFDTDSDESLQTGILTYRTYGNQSANKLTEFDNKFIGISSLRWVRPNAADGGTGANNNGQLVWPKTSRPYMWWKADDSETLTVSGNKVLQWRDKSINNFNLEQATTLDQPITGAGQIGGKNAIKFDGINNFMTIASGPQMLLNSMIFLVVDVDAVTNTQAIFSFNQGLSEKFSAGFKSGKSYFRHDNDGDDNDQIEATVSTGPMLISAYRNGSTLYIDADGQSATSQLGVDIQSNIAEWIVGCLDGDSEHFGGLIGEIRIYRYFDAVEFTEIKSSLEVEWGIDSNNFGQDKPVNILDYSPVLWLDAGDAATITASGNELISWNDKSGNGRNASQTTPTLRPGTGTYTINGRNAITSVGIKYIDLASPVNVRTLIAVFMTNGDAENEYSIFGGELDGAPVCEVRWRSAFTPQISLDGSVNGGSSGKYALNGGEFSSSSSNHSVAGITADEVHIVSIQYDAAFALQRLLGRDAGSNVGLSGIAEMVWFEGVLSDAERSLIENSLSIKYGGSI